MCGTPATPHGITDFSKILGLIFALARFEFNSGWVLGIKVPQRQLKAPK
jgi:hypothetical protein